MIFLHKIFKQKFNFQACFYLTFQDEIHKFFLVNPVNSIDHYQARKNPPRVADLEIGNGCSY